MHTYMEATHSQKRELTPPPPLPMVVCNRTFNGEWTNIFSQHLVKQCMLFASIDESD